MMHTRSDNFCCQQVLCLYSEVTEELLCSCLSQASLVAQNLPFARDLNTLAGEVVDGMKRAGAVLYNGIHLRIEKDAEDWKVIMGGEKVHEVSPRSVIFHLCMRSWASSLFTSKECFCLPLSLVGACGMGVFKRFRLFGRPTWQR